VELVTGLFIVGLYKATEKIWEKGFDAAWAPVDEALKKRFARWAGRDKEGQRQAAFSRAAGVARANTLRYAADPDAAARILDVLDSERDPEGAKALAGEAAKLMLFSATPDLPRLTELCQKRLRWDAVWGEGEPPAAEAVAAVLSDFLTNLREALLDREPYHDLIQREILRTLRQIAAPPVVYDDEATYRYQVAEMYRQLEFVGIPELKERRPITVEDVFIRLRAERQIEAIPDWELEEQIREAMAQRDAHRLIALQAKQRKGSIGRKVTPEERQQWLHELTAAIEARDAMATLTLRRRLERTTSFVTEVSIEESLRQADRMAILGDPGTGKTTLLKYLTVICAEGRAEAELGLGADGAGSPLPVFIPLREFAAECAGRNQDYCLLDYLYTHAREHLLLNLPQGFFEEALKAGRCLVCLDGLDEVWAVGQRKAVADEVRALAARFPRNRYLVTSRIVGYEEAPLDRRDFVHHTVLPLEDDDVHEFVRKWYEVRERDPVQRKHKADDLIATIDREPRIKSLATNPLLLTIIALVHRIEAELPQERVKLYDKCVTALVDTWEEVKGLTIEEKQRPFYRYRRRLLERLAYELHAGAEEPGQLQMVKAGDLELMLTRLLMENRRLGLAGDLDGARDEAQAFVRLARGRTGLLVERGEGIFGFPHLTFQEYLAACDVENRCIHRGVDAIWEEIEDRLHDSRWQEVILLLLGSLNKYDEPPTLLVERILEAGKEDRFEPVLHRHLYLAARALADRVEVAADLRRRVVDAILGIVREPVPWWVRGDAFTALSWLGDDLYTANGLLAMARDEKVAVWVRSDAAVTLGQLGHAEEATELLLVTARDERLAAWLRSDAASAVGQLGHAEEAAAILLAIACNEKVAPSVRSSAGSALRQLGRADENVLNSLLDVVHDEEIDDKMHSVAASILGRLGCADVKVLNSLLALIHNPQVAAWVRSDAALALGRLGRADEKVVDGLLSLARDEEMDDEMRSAVASVLGRLECADEKVLNYLLALMRNPQVAAWVRSDAALALGRLGRADEKVVDGLLSLVRDQQVAAWVCSDAVRALGQLGRADEKVLNGLLDLARNEEIAAELRSHAAGALGRLGHVDEKVLDGILALTQDKDEDIDVRVNAIDALGQMGCASGKVLDTLLDLAHDEEVDSLIRGIAVWVLGQLGRADEKVVDGLLALVSDEEKVTGLREDIALALDRLGDASAAAEILLELALDEKAGVGRRCDAYKNLKRLVGGVVEPLEH
jgi:hypothetical protein